MSQNTFKVGDEVRWLDDKIVQGVIEVIHLYPNDHFACVADERGRMYYPALSILELVNPIVELSRALEG